MKTITLATFNQLAEAEPLKERLQGQHIAAEIHDETGAGRFWFAAQPYAGVRLEVPTKEYQHALRLFHTWDTPEGVAHAALHCPECGSSRIEYPQYTRKFFLPNIVGALAALGVLEKDFYCMDCQNTWPPPGQKKHKEAAHPGPNYFLDGVEPPKGHHKARH